MCVQHTTSVCSCAVSSSLQVYRALLDRHEELLVQLDLTARRLPDVQRAIDEFELQKVCYLPLTTFLLKPVQRLLHYQLLLDRKLLHLTALPLSLTSGRGGRGVSWPGLTP